MKLIQNTLYVLTQGAYIHHDHQSVKIDFKRENVASIPLHNINGIVCFGNVMVSPSLMGLSAKSNISVTFLSEGGRIIARVDAPASGNVLLRREQFRFADRPDVSTFIARNIVAGKLQNSRNLLLRSARNNAKDEDSSALRTAASFFAQTLSQLEQSSGCDEIRGYEGSAARVYFGVFDKMIKSDREAFAMKGRNRYPPRDITNSLLSYTYALLLSDCVSGAVCAGLDPSVGFLHTDRPGRPSLALDLMEEFRSVIADRFVLKIINRRQVSQDSFVIMEGGSVRIKDNVRKEVVKAWQQQKNKEITHPLLKQKTSIGLLPHLQAKIMARYIRGDIEAYAPCVLK